MIARLGSANQPRFRLWFWQHGDTESKICCFESSKHALPFRLPQLPGSAAGTISVPKKDGHYRHFMLAT